MKIRTFALLTLAFISASANAMDEAKRRAECALLVEPFDGSTIARAIRNAHRTGESPDPRLIIRATQSTLDGVAGQVFQAKDHKPSTPLHFQGIRADLQTEAEWWYNPGTRELKAGDQFITRNGEHRWTKVLAGRKEVWRAPDGLLIGDTVGQAHSDEQEGVGLMTHFDAQRIDRALKMLFDQAKQDGSGEWRWPEWFDPDAFLWQEMSRNVHAETLSGSDPWRIASPNGTGNVAVYYDTLMDSIGWILEPNIPWRLPVQQGDGIENTGLTQEFGLFRSQGALEVLNNTSDRWFWSSSVPDARWSFGASIFNGSNGDIISNRREVSSGSIRVVARRR